MPVGFGRLGSKVAHEKKREQKEEVKDKEGKKKLEGALEEKYGKGLKMLKNMGGFQIGHGVGKNNQGILNPVELKKGKGNECLGAGHHANQDGERQGGKSLVAQKSTDPAEIAQKH